jgi:hypothetical protein
MHACVLHVPAATLNLQQQQQQQQQKQFCVRVLQRV